MSNLYLLLVRFKTNYDLLKNELIDYEERKEQLQNLLIDLEIQHDILLNLEEHINDLEDRLK
jgi:hypothetical protein